MPDSTVSPLTVPLTSQQLIPVQMSVIKATSKGLICSPVGLNAPINAGYHLVYQDQQGKFQVSRVSVIPAAPDVLTKANTNVTMSTTNTSTTLKSTEFKSELCRQLCIGNDSVAPKVSKITATQIGNDDKVYTVGITPETQHTTTITLAQPGNTAATLTTSLAQSETTNNPSLAVVPVQVQSVVKALEEVLPTSSQTDCAKSFDLTFTFNNDKGASTTKAVDNTNNKHEENRPSISGVAQDEVNESSRRKRKGDYANNSSISLKNSRKQSFKVRDFDELSFSELIATSDESKHGNTPSKANPNRTSALASQLLKHNHHDAQVVPSMNQEDILKMWSSLLDPGRIPFPGIWYDYHGE